MRRSVKKLLGVLCICVLLIVGAVILLIYLNGRDIRHKKELAKYMIGKVEDYKRKYHKLPKYEADMNLNLPDDYPIHYAITKDSTVYSVGFQIAPFKDFYYKSDTKKWYRQH